MFPVNTGPATVPVTGEGASTGAATVLSTADVQPLDLGPNFGVNRMDVTFPQNSAVSVNVPTWSSVAVPELNGESIDLDVDIGVFNVDAVNGLVDVAFFGTIFAPSPSPPPPPGGVPNLPTWGLILLAAGILGMVVVLLRQRRST